MQPHQLTKRNQSGFGVVEVLIIVLVIAALAGTIYAAYQRLKHTGAKNSAATSQHQATTQPAQTATQYFTIKEWGVRAPYSGNLKLSYTLSSTSSGGGSAVFSSDQLTALSNACIGGGGAITRWAPYDQVSEGPPDANTPTAANFFAGKDPSTFPYAHIGNYYYMFVHVQGGCSDLNTTGALQSQTNNAVKALVVNLQAIPGATVTHQSADNSFSFSYPSDWYINDSLNTLAAEDQIDLEPVSAQTIFTNAFRMTLSVVSNADSVPGYLPDGTVRKLTNGINLWISSLARSEVPASPTSTGTMACPHMKIMSADEKHFSYPLKNGKYLTLTGGYCQSDKDTSNQTYDQLLAGQNWQAAIAIIQSIKFQ